MQSYISFQIYNIVNFGRRGPKRKDEHCGLSPWLGSSQYQEAPSPASIELHTPHAPRE